MKVILLEADSFTCCRGRSVFGTHRAEFHSRDSQRNWSDTAHSLGLLIADLFRRRRCLSKNICSSSGWKHIRGRFCLCILEETLISLSSKKSSELSLFLIDFFLLKSLDCEEWTSVHRRNLLALPSKSTLTLSQCFTLTWDFNSACALHLVALHQSREAGWSYISECVRVFKFLKYTVYPHTHTHTQPFKRLETFFLVVFLSFSQRFKVCFLTGGFKTVNEPTWNYVITKK